MKNVHWSTPMFLLICLNYLAWIFCGMRYMQFFFFFFLHSLLSFCRIYVVMCGSSIVLCNPLWMKWFYSHTCWGFWIKVWIWAFFFMLDRFGNFHRENWLGPPNSTLPFWIHKMKCGFGSIHKEASNLEGSGHVFSSSFLRNDFHLSVVFQISNKRLWLRALATVI